MKRTVLLAIIGFSLVVVGLPSLFFLRFLHTASGAPVAPFLFDIKPGQTLFTVATELQTMGLLKNAKLFLLYARVTRSSSKMKVGEYEIDGNMSPAEILQTITSGKSFERSLTISEGLNIFEIADLVNSSGIESRERFLATVRDPRIVEQLLGEKR